MSSYESKNFTIYHIESDITNFDQFYLHNHPDKVEILVMYEGEIVGELDPKKTTVQELGLYMAGAKRNDGKGGAVNE